MLNMPLMDNNIRKEDVDCLIKFLQTNNIFTQSSKVREFEEKWSQWLGVKYSVFVNSGSSANFITMAIIKELYGHGEIITSPIGWASDVAAILNMGHKPVFVDVNLKNLSMNEEKILKAITPATKAVLLTHVLGFNALSRNLISELENRKILLIEDCCESHGATLDNKKIGTFGKVSNFSFYYAHHMSTIEGGIICTDDEKIYEYARMFRSHGMIRECDSLEYREKFEKENTETHPEFTFVVPGFNMRSTELNAVIGLNQIKRLDNNNLKRHENFKLFIENLNSEKYFLDYDIVGSVNYAFILILKEKDKKLFDKISEVLTSEKVEFRRGTAGGGNQARQRYLQKIYPEINPSELSNAEHIHEYGMYLGNYPELDKEKILMLCEVLNNI